MSSLPAELNRIALRDFILKRFSREELLTFALDYFRDFYEEFEGANLSKTTLVNNLLTHCERRDELPGLQAGLQQARPAPYAAAFERIAIAYAPTKLRDPRQIFLSYSTKDLPLAQQLAGDLRDAGLSVFFAFDSIAKGEKWTTAIDRGLNESGIFVVMLSPNAVQSEWVKEETDIALEQKDAFKFFSLMMRACDVRQLSNRLTLRQHIEFEQDYDAGLAALCQAIGVTPQGSNPLKGFDPLPPSPPAPPPPSSQWRALQQRVDAALTYQQWDEATRLIDNWLALEPNDPDALATQARLPELRRTAEVEARATQLNESHEKLGEALADENWEKAQRHASILLQLEPNLPRAERAIKFAQAKLDEGRSQILKSLAVDWVHIPAGAFLYGENKQKIDLPEYWMSRTPVTVAQYWAFLQATQHPREGYWKWDEDIRKPYLKHPAVDVNWEDVNAFCKWASQVTGNPIQLPSEQQWEKAAHGADGREYPWGNEAPDDTRCNFNKYEQWKAASGEGQYGFTTAVGSFSLKGDSPYKLQDMAGNVWEWCADWYDTSNKARVVRGGAFLNYDVASLRCAHRGYRDPTLRYDRIGFRVGASHLSHL